MTQRQPLVINPAAGGDTIQQMQSGDTLAVLNGGMVRYRGNVAVTTGTTLIPFGNAAPLSTGGTQLWTQTVTPSLTTTTFELDMQGMVDSSVSGDIITVAFFVGTTLLAFTCVNIATTNKPENFALKALYAPGSISSITFSCRIGIATAGTWSLGRGATATMGGVNNTAWTINESL